MWKVNISLSVQFVGVLLMSLWLTMLYFWIVHSGHKTSRTAENDTNFADGITNTNVTYNWALNKAMESLKRAVNFYQVADSKSGKIVRKIEELRRLIEHDMKIAINSHSNSAIAVLVFASERGVVSRCLQRLLEVRPSAERFPIIVSQDRVMEKVANEIRYFGDKVFYIRQEPMRLNLLVGEKRFNAYYKIAGHYAKALNQTFLEFGFNHTVIVEDDLYVSDDFFEYFSATLPILQADQTLLCVSAWNDNGKNDLIQRDASHLLHRTDFFPGLGWMLSKSVWLELAPKWPARFWDDWLRMPGQMKSRACIRPEISRTKHMKTIGTSGLKLHQDELKHIVLNRNYTHFTKLDLSYLLKPNYDVRFLDDVYRSDVISIEELEKAEAFETGSMWTLYCEEGSFEKTAKSLGLMSDIKSGLARTSYKGVVSFFTKNARIFLIVIPKFSCNSTKNRNSLNQKV